MSKFTSLFLCLFLASAVLGGEILVRNSGNCFWTTSTALTYLSDEVLDYKPDTVILSFGLRDATYTPVMLEPEDYESNYRQLISRLKENGIEKIAIMTSNPVIELKAYTGSYRRFGKLNERIDILNEIVRKLAREENLVLVDLNGLVKRNGGAVESEASFLRNRKNGGGTDGTHLTAKAYQALAAEVARVLKPGKRVVCYGDDAAHGANLPGAGTVRGQNYPSYLWKIWNGQLAGGGRTPTEMRPATTPEDGNLIRNADYKVLRVNVAPKAPAPATLNSLPVGWHFWKKNKDMLERREENGSYYLRLSGAGTFLRSEEHRNGNGSYRLSCKLRGKGKIHIGCGVYDKRNVPRRHILLKPALEDAWHEFSANFSLKPENKIFFLYFENTGTADIKDCKMLPVKEPVAPAKYSLKSDLMSVGFCAPEDGGGMVSLKNAAGREYLNVCPSGELWSLVLRKIKFDASGLPSHINLGFDPERNDGRSSDSPAVTKDLQFNSRDAVKLGARTSVKRIGKNELLFEWTGLRVNDEENALDVQVRISLDKDGACHIGGSFANRSSQYTVFYFNCPTIAGLGGMHGDFAADSMALPFFNGRLVKNPVQKGFLGKPHHHAANNSNHSMHFDVYSNGGDSLYLAVLDTRQYLKRWYYSADAAHGITWAVVNVPDNMRKVPQCWTVPYTTLIRPFRGDWFDGCKMYRKWALKQYWSPKEKVEFNKDIPQWFKEISTWVLSAPIEETARLTGKFIKEYGRYKLGIWTFYWGNKAFEGDKMYNPERFPIRPQDKKLFDLCKSTGTRITAYIQATSWPDDTECYRKNPGAAGNLVRNYYGQIRRWPYEKSVGNNWNIAYPGAMWTKNLGDMVVKMAEHGIDVAYMDSGNHGGTYMNFTPECNPGECGGGRGYVQGSHDLLKTIRARARKVNPEFCISTESFWEGNLCTLDSTLATNTTTAYLEDQRVIAIPMAHAVYHGYSIFHSAWASMADVREGDADGFIAKFAQLFCWGVKDGFETMSEYYLSPRNRTVAIESTHHRYEAYNRAVKYLMYGEMLHEPKVNTPVETHPVRWYRAWSKSFYKLNLPSFFSSMWAANDGSKALVAYNISLKPVMVEFELDGRRYGKFGQARAIYPDMLNYKTRREDEKTLVKVILPSRVPVVIEFGHGKE